MPITIAIVEDNTAVCASLKEVITETDNYRCVCVCQTGTEAIKTIPAHKPDVVIMDIELPDFSGIECTARLKRLFPEMQILIFTVYKNHKQIFRALEAGASGYILKRNTPGEIMQAIADVKAGGAPMSAEIARLVVQSFRKPLMTNPSMQDLTQRETEIIGLLAQGYVSKEIADKTGISYETVRSHLQHIYEKLHVRTRTEAVLRFYEKM
ncbi:MAG: response regulator transcription factor [Opitutaceae bacterium]|jgi:DNA-binding NarL/FixJ family response regulator